MCFGAVDTQLLRGDKVWVLVLSNLVHPRMYGPAGTSLQESLIQKEKYLFSSLFYSVCGL